MILIGKIYYDLRHESPFGGLRHITAVVETLVAKTKRGNRQTSKASSRTVGVWRY